MEKTKSYKNTKFSSSVWKAVIRRCEEIANSKANDVRFYCEEGDERWVYDTIDEFVPAYSKETLKATRITANWHKPSVSLLCMFMYHRTDLTVSAPTRGDIESVFSILEEARSEDVIKYDDAPSHEPLEIFIGHGGAPDWQKLRDHLRDKHDLNVISFESGARAGHAIRDILDDLVDNSSFALLVLTAEDHAGDKMRARQNVIHECGLFQGRLGFDRAVMLVEEGVELASNFDGIQQLRFGTGRISEVFGDVLATLRREFGPI